MRTASSSRAALRYPPSPALGSAIMRVFILVTAIASCVSTAAGQTASNTAPVPRTLPAPSVISPRFAGNAFSVIALSNGSLLVNDIRNHRVMLSDSLMRVTSIVIDSAEYGTRPGSVMRHLGTRWHSSNPLRRQ